jgi:hypothetical protein
VDDDAYEVGTDSVFRNVGQKHKDAGDLPKRKKTELGVFITRRNGNAGRSVSISFDISQMNGRILVPYQKIFNNCIIYTDRNYLWDRKIKVG